MFRALAPRLRAKGWRAIIPLVQNEKRPAIDAWQRFNEVAPSADQIKSWCASYENSGVGLCAGPDNIVGVDLDFIDQPIAQAAWGITSAILGSTPLIRIGRAPKRMAFYKIDPKTIIPGRSFGGFEIFTKSGQTVLFGVHPETQREYEYIGGLSPLDISPGNLPIAPGDKIRALIAELNKLVAVDRMNRFGTGKMRSAPARKAITNQSIIDNAASDRASGCVANIAPILDQSSNPLAEAGELIKSSAVGDRHPIMLGVVIKLAGMGFSDREIEDACHEEYVSKFHGGGDRSADFYRALSWARDAVGPDRKTILNTPQMRSIASKWRRG
jgi:hypothetical protein